jgi:hypothetical protein
MARAAVSTRPRSNNDTIVVYNRKSIEQIEKEGGCGYWPIGHDPGSLLSKGIRFVLCIRNRPGEPGHGQPYFVASLDERHVLRPQRNEDIGKPRKQLLKLLKWAPVADARTWPCKEMFEYRRLNTFGINFRSLPLREFQTAEADDDEEGTRPGVSLKVDGGARGSGKRSETTWSAKHDPLCKRIVESLKGFKGLLDADNWPWNPYVLFETPDQRLVLIEVKPNSDSHNVITAIGQLIAYSHGLAEVIRIVAAWSSRNEGSFAGCCYSTGD